MKNLPIFIICFLLVAPSASFGQKQIESDDPNDPYNNLGQILITTPDWVNYVDRFANYESMGQFGLVQIASAGHLRNYNSTEEGAPVLFENQSNFSVLNSGGQGVFTNEGVFQNQGTYAFTKNDGGLIDNKAGGTINNFAGNADGTSGISNKSGTLTNQGTINNGLSGQLVYENAIFNNLSNGVINNQKDITNSAKMNNHGHVYNQLDGNLTNYDGAVLTNTSGALIRNSGTFTNWGTLINNGVIETTDGTFTNNGTFGGSSHIHGTYIDHGITKPGNSAGVKTINGNYFKYNGSMEIELGGLFDGGGDHAITEFDWIDVTGNVELNGLLNVSLIDRFEKRINRGQVFEFIRVGGTLSGHFEGLREGDLVGNFGGQDLFITYGGMGDGGGVALFTNAVPEPTTMLIWSMLAGLGMTVRRRR